MGIKKDSMSRCIYVFVFVFVFACICVNVYSLKNIRANADLRCIRSPGLLSILEPPMGIKSPCLDVSQDRATKRSAVQSTMLYQNWDKYTSTYILLCNLIYSNILRAQCFIRIGITYTSTYILLCYTRIRVI